MLQCSITNGFCSGSREQTDSSPLSRSASPARPLITRRKSVVARDASDYLFFRLLHKSQNRRARMKVMLVLQLKPDRSYMCCRVYTYRMSRLIIASQTFDLDVKPPSFSYVSIYLFILLDRKWKRSKKSHINYANHDCVSRAQCRYEPIGSRIFVLLT